MVGNKLESKYDIACHSVVKIKTKQGDKRNFTIRDGVKIPQNVRWIQMQELVAMLTKSKAAA